MYAIIESGGKQLKVEEGSVIYVEKLDVNAGDEVVIDKVCLVSDAATKIGTPYVEGATVTCKVEKQGKEKKVRTFMSTPWAWMKWTSAICAESSSASTAARSALRHWPIPSARRPSRWRMSMSRI